MSKDSSDNFIELNPGDVIYVNEDLKIKKDIVKDPEVSEPEPAEESKPLEKSKAPTFDIPLAEERKSEPIVRPVQQLFDEPSKEETEEIPSTVSSPKQDFSLKPAPVISETLPKPQTEVLPPVVDSFQKSTPPPIPQPQLSPIQSELPKPPTPPPIPQPQLSPIQSELPKPPTPPPIPQPQLSPIQLELPKPPTLQILNPLQQTVEQTALNQPKANQPVTNHLGQNLELRPHDMPPTPDSNIVANQQILSIPPPLASSLPPPKSTVLPLVTTDMQGNLGLLSNQNISQPVILPQPVSVPAVDTDDEGIKDLPIESGGKSTKRLKIFRNVTILIILATIVVGTFFLLPKIQAIIDGRRLNEVDEFEAVLVNLLQIKNQEIEVELTDSQFENFVPALGNQSEIIEGKVSVKSVLRMKYSTGVSNPNIGSKFRFDLNLRTNEGPDNLALDVVTVFIDGEAYFKIESLSINDRSVNLRETTFADRWSNLEALLQVQSGDGGEELVENNSVFLNYIANLLNLYSHPHYVVFLPTFNVTQSQQYKRIIEEVLSKSQAYDLDTGSCETLQDAETKCKIRINYSELHALYEEIYSIIDEDMPAYYNILKIADNRNSNLPKVIELTFDKDRDLPISLSVPASDNDISASGLMIDYKNFDESSFEIETFSNPLDISEYHEQILKYEEEVNYGT